MAQMPAGILGETNSHTQMRRTRGLPGGRTTVVLIFAAPALLLFSVYLLYPVAVSVWYSLLQWNGIGAAKFVGFANWSRLLHDSSVETSLRNTLIILAGSVVLEIPIGLLVAQLVQELGRAGAFLSSVYVLPLLSSSVAVGLTWTNLYNPQFGPLYYIFNHFGQQAPALLGSPTWAVWAVTVVVAWEYVPIYILLFNAGLLGIPTDLYEAAAIDGASGWIQFWTISIPLLKRTFVTAVILIITGSLVYFDLIYVMTSGGPGDASYTLSLYVYRAAFQNQDIGYGSALAVLLFAISFVVSAIIVRGTRLLQEQ